MSSVRIMITAFDEYNVELKLEVSAEVRLLYACMNVCMYVCMYGLKYWRMCHQNAIVDPLTMLELYRSLIARSGPLTRVLSGLQNFVGRRKTGIRTYIHLNVYNDTCINTYTYIHT